MSLQTFGFGVVSGDSTASAVDVSAEPAAAAAAPQAVAPVAAPAPASESARDASPQPHLSKFTHNPSLKAYCFKHGNWLRAEDKKSALCPVPSCGMVVPCAGNTTNLDSHTRRHHKAVYDEQVLHRAELERTSSSSSKTKLKFEPRSLTQQALLGAVAEFIVLDQQPFNVVEADSFKNLIQVAANDTSLTVPSRPTVSKRVSTLAISARGNIREQMKGTRPALTTDGWTSCSGVPYLSLTGHWIREGKPELVSATLACCEFRGSHTSVRLAEKITEMMDLYDLKKTAVALTTDTAANIKKAGKQLLPQEWHPCVCHLLQLCALKILNEPHVKATFAKHNRLTNHLHSSSTSSEKLVLLQKAAEKPPKVIPTHCPTRWNSNYEQGCVVLDNRFVVQQLCSTLAAEGKLSVTYTEADWENTRAAVDLLRLFAEATEIMQGDNFITNSMMPMIASNLHVFCVTKACDMDLPEYIRDAADLMFDDVQDRFYPPTNCAMIAATCDPRVKKLTWCDSTEKKMYHKVTVDAMVDVMLSTNDSGTSQAPAAGAPAAGAPADDASDQPASSPARVDLRKKEPVNKSTLLFTKMLAVSAVAAEDEAPELAPLSPGALLAERKRAAGYELERYLQGENLADTSSSQMVLDWWFNNRMVYPVLYRVACIYLAVPASSASSERVFSTAGNIVTKKRNSLGTDSVNNLVFLHGCHGVGWEMGDSNPRSQKIKRFSSK